MIRLCVTLAFLFALADPAQAATRGRGEVGSRAQTGRISGQSNTTCVVLESGTVRCWGYNRDGQIGDGTQGAMRTPPAQVLDLSGVVAVASGHYHTCALLATGTVSCWGENSRGQLGPYYVYGSSLTPVSVFGLTGVVGIVAGNRSTCALVAWGSVRCWGNGARDFVEVGGIFTAVSITAGDNHVCALLVNGTASCWGDNGYGQLGDGANEHRSNPVLVSGLSGVVEIAAGSNHTCALLVDGTGRCWGRNDFGQLGDGTLSHRNTPAPVSQLSGAIGITAAIGHACVVRYDGGVRCWGRNDSGQLGDGTNNQHLDAGTAVAGLNNAVAVSAGASHTCALDATGAVRCWGNNFAGQLGNGTTAPSSTPAAVTGINGSVGARAVVAGEQFTCALRGNGTAACWGDDALGQLGNGGTFTDSPNPATVSGLTNVVGLSAGLDHACALRSRGTVHCWGRNTQGQLGIGNTTSQSAPVTVGRLDTVVGIAAGNSHTCALMIGGEVFCWGFNEFGQLGTGDRTDLLAPTSRVVGVSNAVAIAAGGGHTCALLVNGAVRCWGANTQGQLGNGTTNTAYSSVAVSGLTGFVVALAAGASHTCALTAEGSKWCWGDNFYGQLGNSTNADRLIPDFLYGTLDAIGVTAGGSHTCALRGGGVADCWGRNTNGELGAADAANHNAPTPVIRLFVTIHGVPVPVALSRIVAITAGSAHTCALLASGAPNCWGDNSQGQLGDGTLTDRPRPTTVPSFTANVDPAGALKSNGRIAELAALLNCEPGGHGQIYVSLTQGTVVGYGVASTNCGYGLLEVPVVVPAHGPGGFQPGPATATLEAIVREEGQIVDHLFWTRAVVLAP